MIKLCTKLQDFFLPDQRKFYPTRSDMFCEECYLFHCLYPWEFESTTKPRERKIKIIYLENPEERHVLNCEAYRGIFSMLR